MKSMRHENSIPETTRTRSERICRRFRAMTGEAVDGRLPRKHEQVYRAHILSCPACRKSYEELRRLKEWTRSLPSEELSGAFHETLQARILSGEGTPEGALDAPIPLGQQVRFFASGAATAAALLISAWLVVDGLTEMKGRGRVPTAPRPPVVSGMVSTPDRETAGGSQLRIENLDPLVIARDLYRSTTAGIDELQAAAPRLRQYPPRKALDELQRRSRDLQTSARLVRALGSRLFEFDPETEGFLRELDLRLSEIDNLCCKPEISRKLVDQAIERIRRLRKPGPASIRVVLDSRSPRDMFDFFRILDDRRIPGNGPEGRNLMEYLERFLEKAGGNLVLDADGRLFRVEIRGSGSQAEGGPGRPSDPNSSSDSSTAPRRVR